MATGVNELITMLYDMVQDAFSVPLSGDKCILEREKVLDLIDEIKLNVPEEIAQARKIVEARNEIIERTRKDAEAIKRHAEEDAEELVANSEIMATANRRAEAIIETAEQQAKELRQAANKYADDVMFRTKKILEEAKILSQQNIEALSQATAAYISGVQKETYSKIDVMLDEIISSKAAFEDVTGNM